MQTIRILFIILVAGLCRVAPVSADCLIIDQIDNMHRIQARMLQNPATALFTTDVRQLRHLVSRISDRDTLIAVDGNPFAGRGPAFVTFVQNTRALLNAVSMDDPFSTRRHFVGDVRENMTEVAAYLPELRCTAEQVAIEKEAAAERDFAGDTEDEDAQEVREALNAMAEQVFRVRTLVAFVVIVLALVIGLPLLRKWRHLRRRRARRHPTTYQTSFRNGEETNEGFLLDINCYGAKLRHARPSPHEMGEALEIAILDNWTNGTVRWSNAHYSGVQFNKRIALASVATICEISKTQK